MTRRRIIVLAVVLLGIAAVPFLYGGPHGRGHRGMFGDALGHLEHIKAELDLSDQQVAEIKTIIQAARQENATYHDQLHGGIAAIVDSLIQNPSDVARAQALLDQQAQAERALKSNILTAVSKALSVLTPEQRAKAAKLVDEHRDGWHGKRRS